MLLAQSVQHSTLTSYSSLKRSKLKLKVYSLNSHLRVSWAVFFMASHLVLFSVFLRHQLDEQKQLKFTSKHSLFTTFFFHYMFCKKSFHIGKHVRDTDQPIILANRYIGRAVVL